MKADSGRRANLEPQMNGGLRSPGGKLGRHKSRSAPHSVAPLDSISKFTRLGFE
jgi:hypothetical protein